MVMIPHQTMRLLFEFLKIRVLFKNSRIKRFLNVLETLSTRHIIITRALADILNLNMSREHNSVCDFFVGFFVCGFLVTFGCCNFFAFYVCLIFLVTVLSIEFIVIIFSLGNKRIKC